MPAISVRSWSLFVFRFATRIVRFWLETPARAGPAGWARSAPTTGRPCTNATAVTASWLRVRYSGSGPRRGRRLDARVVEAESDGERGDVDRIELPEGRSDPVPVDPGVEEVE